jgi:hypothetical protein
MTDLTYTERSWDPTQDLSPRRRALLDPIRWKRGCLVRVGPLFHAPFERIAEVFGVMASSPQHSFHIRVGDPACAQRFFKWVVEQDAEATGGTPGLLHCVYSALRAESIMSGGEELHQKYCADSNGEWPLTNVWYAIDFNNLPKGDFT